MSGINKARILKLEEMLRPAARQIIVPVKPGESLNSAWHRQQSGKPGPLDLVVFVQRFVPDEAAGAA